MVGRSVEVSADWLAESVPTAQSARHANGLVEKKETRRDCWAIWLRRVPRDHPNECWLHPVVDSPILEDWSVHIVREAGSLQLVDQTQVLRETVNALDGVDVDLGITCEHGHLHRNSGKAPCEKARVRDICL